MNDYEVKEIIDKVIKRMHKNFDYYINQFELTEEAIQVGQYTQIKDLMTRKRSDKNKENYGFEEPSKPYNINRLASIGWPDPFPNNLPVEKSFL